MIWTINLLLLLSAAGPSLVRCIVDETSPDLSVYNLRHTGVNCESKHPIRDYATAAIQLRNSLISTDFQVRCSTYAHLLKLIRRVKANDVDSVELNLDTVMALATVAQAEREQYQQLFDKYQPEVLNEIFRETIEELERRFIQTSASKDAWLELIECAKHSPSEQLELFSFLNKPHRAIQVIKYKEFKALPVSHEQTFGGSNPQEQSDFSEEEIEKARAKVELFDDAELRRLREALRNHRNIEETRSTTKTPAQEQDAPVENDKLVIDITVPSKDLPRVSEPMDEDLIDHHLSVLEFLGRWLERLEAQPKGSVHMKSKLNVEAAADYQHSWLQLESILRDGRIGGESAEQVRAYLANDKNRRVFARMDRIVNNFTHVVEALMQMKTSGNNYKSMDHLNATYGNIIKLLEEVDELVSVYDLTRAVLNNRKREHQEYKAMNKFINSESW